MNFSYQNDQMCQVICCEYQVDDYKYRSELLPGVGEE